MILVEHHAKIYEDEKREKEVTVRSFELSGWPLPREKNIPVMFWMSFCRPLFLTCSHQGADIFLGFPISLGPYLKLLWNRWTTPVKAR